MCKLTVLVGTGCHFGEISVIVTLHLQVENLALGAARLGNQKFVQQTLIHRHFTI